MQGLEIAKQYYNDFGKEDISRNFPEFESVMAIGLAGSGSECYGFDDETSRDHDFEPGFCIWIPEEDVIDSRSAFKIERWYAKLPREYMGLKRSVLQPAGGNRHGVLRYSEFLERHIGKKNTDLTIGDWFNIPECALSEVVNGEIWRDDSGCFTAIRNSIKNMPRDVRLKKLAGSLYIMGQSGKYNYLRCIAHGEKGAAQLSLSEFVKHTMHCIYLINNEYMPYYKWSFRALKKLPLLSELGDKLEYLLNTGNDNMDVENKIYIIDSCGSAVIDLLKEHEYTDKNCDDLGLHAEIVNGKIRDSYIKNADILAGVSTTL